MVLDHRNFTQPKRGGAEKKRGAQQMLGNADTDRVQQEEVFFAKIHVC